MKLKITILLGLTFITTFSYARVSFNEHFTGPTLSKSKRPWFTGPILTPSGHVVPKGHQNYEPYVYFTQYQGFYSPNWKFHSQPTFNNLFFQGSMQFGVFHNTELGISPQYQYNQKHGQHMWRMGDLPISVAFQLLSDENAEAGYPAVKLILAANIPLAKYDQLNPIGLETDAGGIGTWYPGIGLAFAKVFCIKNIHYLSWRVFFAYNVGTPVNVRGLSIYGGVSSCPGVNGTRGTVYPGNSFLILNGFEYSLTQRFALALDVQYQHSDNTRFSGYSPPETRPVSPSQELFALAPGIEYNLNENIGIIMGPWFSVGGRNASQFKTYVAALNIFI